MLMHYVIDEMIPGQIELVHGPGCPVCVTALETLADDHEADVDCGGSELGSFGDDAVFLDQGF